MKAIWMTLAVALSLSAVACGGGGCKGTCKDASKCDGVEDFDEDACIDQCEAGADAADELGCKSEYDKVISCGDACDPESFLEDCADELEALTTCSTEAA